MGPRPRRCPQRRARGILTLADSDEPRSHPEESRREQAAGGERPRAPMDPVGRVVRVPVPVSKLESFITPSEHLFVVAHMGIARLDAGAWRLHVRGAVDRPLRLTFEELRRLPARTVTAFLECAGNPLRPDVPVRRIANVAWRGVPLRDLLDRAGVRPEAAYVWLEGEDSGEFAGVRSPRYVKDIPLARALQGDVLLAYEVNGEPLSPEHGFPVRAVVPGFYGTSSVKWLSSILLSDARPEGLFTTRLYNREVVEDGQRRLEPVWEVQVESVIVKPARRDVLGLGTHEIRGWAWGASEVARVEISSDGGATWREAEVERRRDGYTWQRFALEWRASEVGRYTLLSRAVDVRGRGQPLRSGLNRVHSVTVTVVP